MESFVYETIRKGCEEYMESEDYTSGAYKNQEAYELCCVKKDFCAFYRQGWFWGLCAGLVLLAIAGSVVGSWCCCCRARGRGGFEASGAAAAGDGSESSEEESGKAAKCPA